MAAPIPSRAPVSIVELDERTSVGVSFTPVCPYASRLVTPRSIRWLSAYSLSVRLEVRDGSVVEQSRSMSSGQERCHV